MPGRSICMDDIEIRILPFVSGTQGVLVFVVTGGIYPVVVVFVVAGGIYPVVVVVFVVTGGIYTVVVEEFTKEAAEDY